MQHKLGVTSDGLYIIRYAQTPPMPDVRVLDQLNLPANARGTLIDLCHWTEVALAEFVHALKGHCAHAPYQAMPIAIIVPAYMASQIADLTKTLVANNNLHFFTDEDKAMTWLRLAHVA